MTRRSFGMPHRRAITRNYREYYLHKKMCVMVNSIHPNPPIKLWRQRQDLGAKSYTRSNLSKYIVSMGFMWKDISQEDWLFDHDSPADRESNRWKPWKYLEGSCTQLIELKSKRRHDIDWIRILAFDVLILYQIGMFFNTWDSQIKNNITLNWLAYAMLFAGTFAGSWTFFEIVKRVWFLRPLFGLKRKRATLN